MNNVHFFLYIYFSSNEIYIKYNIFDNIYGETGERNWRILENARVK